MTDQDPEILQNPEGPLIEETSSAPAASPLVQENPAMLRFWKPLLGGTIVYFALWFAGGYAREFAIAGLQVFPIAVFGLSLYAAREGYRGAKMFSIVWWLLLTLSMSGLILLLSFAVVFEPAFMDGSLEGGDLDEEPALESAFSPAGVTAVLTTAAVLLGGILLGALCFLRPVRNVAGRFTPIDPASFVHASALSLTVAMIVIFFAPLLATGDALLTSLIEQMPETAESVEAIQSQILAQFFGLVWTAPAAFVLVGYPAVRSLRESQIRLGFLRPTRHQILFAVIATPVVFVFATFLEIGIGAIWNTLEWQTTNTRAVHSLFAFAFTPLGALVTAVGAGVGEELVVRGVLQERLGLVLSNLLFTAVHALQYRFDALISVFLFGMLFGLVRKRTNVTVTAIMHGGFDFLIFFGGYLNLT